MTTPIIPDGTGGWIRADQVGQRTTTAAHAMTAPMTLEGAIEEARRRGLRWVAQDGGAKDSFYGPWAWFAYRMKPRVNSSRGLFLGNTTEFLGVGSPNPDGWRNTLTQVTEVR